MYFKREKENVFQFAGWSIFFFLLWWKSEEEGLREVIFEAFFAVKGEKSSFSFGRKQKSMYFCSRIREGISNILFDWGMV